jgi:hypothetical protein
MEWDGIAERMAFLAEQWKWSYSELSGLTVSELQDWYIRCLKRLRERLGG